jgi:DNA invertase Pin-like site-specific DNA recombinase
VRKSPLNQALNVAGLKCQITDMKYGNARISTIDQNADMQLNALQRAGCKKTFTNRRTGATTKRPALTRCVKP